MKEMACQISIEYILELSSIIKQDPASYTSSSIEEVTGKKLITFKTFVNDYKNVFKQNSVL